jgi:hypothetical protein
MSTTDAPTSIGPGLALPWHRDVWTDGDIAEAGAEAVYVPLVCVGGGLGTFTVVDFLRIAGTATDDIHVVSPDPQPHSSFQYLCQMSQMTDDDLMRSDSMSRVDNIWGWPSYALEESWKTRRIRPLWRVLSEPLLSEFYNPTVGAVCAGVVREAARIRWSSMLLRGRATAIRRRAEGGYFVLVDTEQPGRPFAVRRCDFVHLAVGYPSLRLLPDLQRFRERFPDQQRVVHVYEPHSHVYRALAHASGTVLVRGSGIAASRVLQRLIDDRDTHGAQTRIMHLFRTYTRGPRGPRTFRRPGGDGFTYQPFTFPKASGGGQLRDRTLRLEGDERADFIKSMGGSTTPQRKAWERQLQRGRKEGWYRAVVGEVEEFDQQRNGKLSTRINPAYGKQLSIASDYVIDATGLDPDIRQHSLLADLLDHCGARPNPLGRLDVEPDFEVRGTRSGPGRIYASGASTLGGYLAPVDSFWGLSHAAIEICDALARNDLCRKIGPVRSTRQWLRWIRNVTI